MPRVQDEAEIGTLEAADDRAAVHDAGDALQPLRDLDVVDRRVDRRKGAEDAVGPDPGGERRIAFRIEGFGLRHAARHPQHDERVGRGRPRRALRLDRLRLTPDKGGKRCRGGGTDELPAIDARHDVAFFARER